MQQPSAPLDHGRPVFHAHFFRCHRKLTQGRFFGFGRFLPASISQYTLEVADDDDAIIVANRNWFCNFSENILVIMVVPWMLKEVEFGCTRSLSLCFPKDDFQFSACPPIGHRQRWRFCPSLVPRFYSFPGNFGWPENERMERHFVVKLFPFYVKWWRHPFRSKASKL